MAASRRLVKTAARERELRGRIVATLRSAAQRMTSGCVELITHLPGVVIGDVSAAGPDGRRIHKRFAIPIEHADRPEVWSQT
jgi:hypothetical protein